MMKAHRDQGKLQPHLKASPLEENQSPMKARITVKSKELGATLRREGEGAMTKAGGFNDSMGDT